MQEDADPYTPLTNGPIRRGWLLTGRDRLCFDQLRFPESEATVFLFYFSTQGPVMVDILPQKSTLTATYRRVKTRTIIISQNMPFLFFAVFGFTTPSYKTCTNDNLTFLHILEVILYKPFWRQEVFNISLDPEPYNSGSLGSRTR